MALPYYIEGTSKLWIKDNIAPYGANVYSVIKTDGFSPDGSLIFDFFEDFATYSTSVWTTVNGTITSPSNSIINLAATTLNSMIRSVATFSTNNTVEFYCSHVLANSTIGGFWSTTNNQACWLGSNGSDNDDYVYTKNGSTSTATDDSVTRAGTTYYKYGVAYLSSGPKFYVDDTLRRTVTTNIPTGNLNIGFYSTVGEGDFKIDWVRVRKYAETEPTVTVQTTSTGYNVIVKNNLSTPLRNFQISVPASSLGTLTATTSLQVDTISRTSLKDQYRDMYSGCTLNLPDLTRDFSGTHTLTMYNATKTVDRFNCSGNATAFNGSSTRGVVGHNTDLDLFNTDYWTLVGWFRQIGDYSSAWTALFSKAVDVSVNRWNFHIVSNEVGFYIYDADSYFNFAGSYTPVKINDSLWHQVGMVKSGNNVLTYKDGVYFRTFALTNISNFSNTNDMNVGCRLNNGTYEQYLNGEMGEFAVFNGVAWSAVQMQKYYDLSKARFPYAYRRGGVF